MAASHLQVSDGFTAYTLPTAGDVVLRMPAAEARKLGELLWAVLKKRKARADDYPVALAAALMNMSERAGS